jgi:hypothetical protein
VNAGKGADTITLSAANFNVTTLQAGEGQDRINANGLITENLSLIGLGAGTDSIQLGTTVLATVAGGGLADTITFVGAGGAAVVYGDALGVTTEGTGTGGAADGADLISLTAGAAATTIYGAGGSDSIVLSGTVNGSSKISGGNGADVIGGAGLTLAAATLDGGNGFDTISIGVALDAGGVVLGAAGNDSIVLGATATYQGGSINGGDGNDTIVLTNTGGVASFTGLGTVDGGAGVDLISFNPGTATFATTGGFTAAGIGNVAYQAGDVVKLGTALAAGTALNFTLAAATVYVSSGVLTAAIAGSAVGSIAVYDSGDDLVFGIQTASSSFVLINVIGGDDMLKTTVVGQNVTYTASNFGFTLAQSGGSVSITFA